MDLNIILEQAIGFETSFVVDRNNYDLSKNILRSNKKHEEFFMLSNYPRPVNAFGLISQ